MERPGSLPRLEHPSLAAVAVGMQQAGHWADVVDRGGRALASKALVERLGPAEAARLGIDLNRVSYPPLAQLPTAMEKARRDAPAIAVCEV